MQQKRFSIEIGTADRTAILQLRVPEVARIAVLAESLSPRVRNEVDTLLTAGHTVHALYFDPGGRRPQQLNNNGNYTEHTIRVGRAFQGARLGLLLPILYYRIARMLACLHAEVIHTTHLFLLPLAVTVARISQARVVYDAYEMHPLWWSGYLPMGRPLARSLLEFWENVLVKWSDCILTVDSKQKHLRKPASALEPARVDAVQRAEACC